MRLNNSHRRYCFFAGHPLAVRGCTHGNVDGWAPLLRKSRVAFCLFRCVGAVEGATCVLPASLCRRCEKPCCGLLASSCVVVRVGRSVLGRWEGRSTWISSGIWKCRASLAWVCRVSLVSTCRLLRIILVSEAENVTSG